MYVEADTKSQVISGGGRGDGPAAEGRAEPEDPLPLQSSPTTTRCPPRSLSLTTFFISLQLSDLIIIYWLFLFPWYLLSTSHHMK
jgi:hypothetical protein